MILSAISLWKKFDLTNPLAETEWGTEEREGKRYSHLTYNGHAAEEGSVRVYARFARPVGGEKKPAILLLPDEGKLPSDELMNYFVEKGYAVLMPDYSGGKVEEGEVPLHTVYPPSLSHGNFEEARGLYEMDGVQADEGTWFEWAYVALYSIEYLKSRKDIGNIGIVGIRRGGEIAWHVALSSDIQCVVPVNAVGWNSFHHVSKFGENVMHDLSDENHRYIAAVEAQSYAPYIKCPVLMLCAMRDPRIDCDRAYDTYSRIGAPYGNALAYSPESGACIGPNGLTDMDLFLEKNLKGREIYVPDTLNVSLVEKEGKLQVKVECDREGILAEAGIYYAESDVKTQAAFREWRLVHQADGRTVKDGVITHIIQPFAGAKAAFVYAYAKYINGFRVTSKIVCKRFPTPDRSAVKSRVLFTGKEMDAFGVAQYDDYSIGGIFLEQVAVPKHSIGYGNIVGAYSVGGIRTYKISSPRYLPDENALLKFDAYSKNGQSLKILIETADVERSSERYSCYAYVEGGGKWKRIVLRAADFKGENFGMTLQNFFDGSALSFECGGEEEEFAITNILWL